MAFPLRLPHCLATLLLAGVSTVDCMGRVDPNVGAGEPPGTGASSSGASGSSSGATGSSSGSTGSSSGPASSGSSGGGPASSSSSSGGPGDPDCSRLGVPGLERVCPDGTSVGGQYVLSNHQCVLEFPCPPSGSQCTQGAPCSPGTGCGSVSPTSNSSCSSSCSCDGTGHYQCSFSCPPGPPQPVGCTQGAACSPGEGCGSASSGPNGCETSCSCNVKGYLDCSTDCVDAGPPPVTDPCPGLFVPDVCEVCGNGVTECAHAILVNGACQIEICPGG